MEIALDAGAEDIQTVGDVFESTPLRTPTRRSGPIKKPESSPTRPTVGKYAHQRHLESPKSVRC